MSTLKEKAVLIRFSAGLPGTERKDPRLTEEVKKSKKLGAHAGKWKKDLYPKEALKKIKSKHGEARAFHDALTLPYDTGTGILPAGLIKEYFDRMALYRGQLDNMIENEFLKDPERWVRWAVKEHNGTFDPTNYPGCYPVEPMVGAMTGQNYRFEPDEFREVMREKFYFSQEIQPVPSSEHFTGTISALIGHDAASVDKRVQDVERTAQQNLLKRILAPVKHMAETLAKKDPKVYATVVDNIAAIVRVAPKMNLEGDPELDKLIKDCEPLTKYKPDDLREKKEVRDEARAQAEAIVKRLSGYKL